MINGRCHLGRCHRVDYGRMYGCEYGAEAGHGGHGGIVRSNTDALVVGLNYLLTWQVRLTTEYRKAFNGLEDKLIAGLQFAF